jgi:FAD/FMN-containing dehydrogenase
MLQAADPDFIARLAGSLPDDVIRSAEPRYLQEPRGRWVGLAAAVALPRTVQEVSHIVGLCAERSVGIVPWGGGTGLVGGQVMTTGPAPLLLSLERMNALGSVYPTEDVLVAQAGMILADVHKAAEAVDRLFPLSLASQGSACLGGLLSTNAGGLNVLRYGNARDLCLGLEAVLPDGSIFHGLKRLRKDNTGYDLRHLLIGAEGSLGIITAASLKLYPNPVSVATALLVVPSPAVALTLLGLAQARAPGMVSAFELINCVGLDFLAEKMPEVLVPLTGRPEWMVLVEFGLADGLGGAEAVMAGLLETAMEQRLVTDGAIAASSTQRLALWRVREAIPEANRLIGAVSSHDIALPLSAVAEFIPKAGAALARLGEWRINCFGHLGDGNLHYNVFPPKGRSRKDFEDQRDAIKSCVHDLVHDMEGSVSAEHGIGRLKVDDLERYGDAAKLSAMRAIKRALDPKGIMNPGVVLRG